MTPQLVKKHTYNVGWLGKTLKGKLNTEYVVIQRGRTHVVRENESLGLGRANDIEVYEVDVTEYPLQLTGIPETKNSAFFFSVTINLSVKVGNSERVIRINQPEVILRNMAGTLARTIASKYDVEQFMQAEAAIHQALSREDFSATGLFVDRSKITVKIELGKKEREHVNKRADAERTVETLTKQHELDKLKAKHEAELAKQKAAHEAELAKLKTDADIEIHDKQAAYVKSKLSDGDAGQIALEMLDAGYSMQQILDKMIARRDMRESQMLEVFQGLVKIGVIEGHMAQPFIDMLVNSMMGNIPKSGVPQLGSTGAPANAPALPANVQPDLPSIPVASSDDLVFADDPETDEPSSTNSHAGFQYSFPDDDDFDDRPPGPSIISTPE